MATESQNKRIIFQDHPTWIPTVIGWFLVILIASFIFDSNTNLGEVFLIGHIMLLFALFGWARSRRARTTLTDDTLIVRRGLFISTNFEIPLDRIERIQVREPWLLRGSGSIWRFFDSYGTIDVYTRNHPLIPIRAENVREVHDKADKIEQRLTKPADSEPSK